MKKSGSQKSKSPSQLIDARIKELGDWRGKALLAALSRLQSFGGCVGLRLPGHVVRAVEVAAHKHTPSTDDGRRHG